MAYLGNTSLNQNYVPQVDFFSGNGSTTAFTLSRPVASVAAIQAVINNVPQKPGDAYTVSGSTITFTSAPPSGTNNIYVYYTSPNTQVVQPGQGTVGATQVDGSYALWNKSGSDINYTAGNVGIGTSSPRTKVDTTGAITAGFANGTYGDVLYGAYGSGYPTSGIGYFKLATNQTGATDGGLSIYTLASGTLSERMRIDYSGNLLVGVSSFANNSGGVKMNNGAVSANIVTSATSTGGWDHLEFRNANGIVGHITTTGSSTAYVTSSDYRLKENIRPMQNALAKVAQLNPVTYTWKSTGENGQGFIAHELQAVVPDCVSGEKDAVDDEGKPVYQGIDTSFLVATLTKAIQELSAKNTALEARITALEAK